MNELTFDAQSESDTDRLGAALAAVLPPGTTVALVGTLGAGKTRLVQAIAAGCGVPREEVVSPTFVLCQEYEGARTIHHLDAYRLRDEDEFRELGVEELFHSGGLTIIEWADRVAGCLPDERVEIAIEVTGETQRRFRIRTIGDRLDSAISKLAR
ncbi:MAG TPA: tRNA (adenosine(37)-N6)-threonylcarbamoyltransferase complex ATPase subunit type 1 TsaE [Pirellulaceae bacterium]|nr:tRNA (adenosine(37)-N6)-threonylcarbamoyltransferase complex ATPase subunit type 1 TsaE [Pirellulaceae bacterium]